MLRPRASYDVADVSAVAPPLALWKLCHWVKVTSARTVGVAWGGEMAHSNKPQNIQFLAAEQSLADLLDLQLLTVQYEYFSYEKPDFFFPPHPGNNIFGMIW